ncbi:NLR family CARD domain-containing protein 3-like [Osmerus mordax]|uniref:NLR family CARD domain-containing protein 3-like n=1 Tax=Osmerus mordax TaxID=8014 RepID=UPI0035103335
MMSQCPHVDRSTGYNDEQVLRRNEAERSCRSQKSLLDNFYTELHIVASEQSSINSQHEVWQAETAHLVDPSETRVKYHDLFEDPKIKRVLTKGIAGIGKTVTIKMFILDWANGKIDIDIVISLPFRKLNLLSDSEHSLLTLLQVFHSDIKDMSLFIGHTSVLLILDGLDETKFPLDFENNVIMSDVTEKKTVDVLLTNLLNGHLLPNTRLWITARPEAANKLCRQYFHFDQVNEIRGFDDAQKDTYFKTKIKDEEMANKVIDTLKHSPSLYIMCHIPVFSCMSAMVLQNLFSEKTTPYDRPLPTTMTITDMYIHYLIVQTQISFRKYERTQLEDEQAVMTQYRGTILNLGKLAYVNLMRRNVLFRTNDMKDCEISPDDAAKCPGLCTECCDLKHGLYERKIFSFVHLSIQEFFAALYAFYTFANEQDSQVKTKKGKDSETLLDFLKKELNRALDSENGHLDLYVRFLFGVSHDSSRDLLGSILPKMPSSAECHKKLTGYMKILKRKGLSPERCINLIHCLNQFKDQSALERVTNSCSSGKPLSPFQCTAVAYEHMVLNKSEEFDFRNKKTSDEGFSRLVPALRSSVTAKLCLCDVTPPTSDPHFTVRTRPLCATLASVLRSDLSRLTTLVLSRNDLGGSMGVDRLCDGLKHQNCKVETLDLSFNGLGTQDVNGICELLTRPTSKLMTLDLSNNDLGDQGVAFLTGALCRSACQLQVLRLSGCGVTKATPFLNIIQKSDTRVILKLLDLSYNPLEDVESHVVQEFLKLGITVNVEHREESRIKPGLDKYACDLTLDARTANRFLSVSEDGRKATRLRKQSEIPASPETFDAWVQVLSLENLRHRHYIELECVHDAYVGVAYEKIPRKGAGQDVELGCNADSWILYVCKDKCYAQHNSHKVSLCPPAVDGNCSYRIGVYLDWPAGVLCFYGNNGGKRTPLYMFHATFSDPLHLALRLGSPNAVVELSAPPQPKCEAN